MTHDELLERLDELKYDVGDSGMNEEYKAIYALRAVVELHKPVLIATPCPEGRSGCAVMHWSDKYACSCKFWNYPCPTIQAIEKELS